MKIKVGDRMPAGRLWELPVEWFAGCPTAADELGMPQALQGKRIVLFGLPGAYAWTRRRCWSRSDVRANGCLDPLDGLNAGEIARCRGKLRKTGARLGGTRMAIDRKFRGNLHFMCRQP